MTARTHDLGRGGPFGSTGLRRLLALVALALLASAAGAQYKIVHPDGRVTYTDKPPADTATAPPPQVRSGVGSIGTDPAITELPLALRQAVIRHPVALYTTADCKPCDEGRQLLQRRGIPYREWQVLSTADTMALEQRLGGRSVPALTIGDHHLRGFDPADWDRFLDAAGYPRTSALPARWTPPAPAPLTPRVAPEAATRAQQSPPPTRPPEVPPPSPSPGGIRF